MVNQQLQDIQSIVDAMKEGMTDETYLTLCNKMKQLCDDDNENTNMIYEITYIKPWIVRNTVIDSVLGVELCTRPIKTFVKFTKECNVSEKINSIAKNGIVHINEDEIDKEHSDCFTYSKVTVLKDDVFSSEYLDELSSEDEAPEITMAWEKISCIKIVKC